MAGEEATVPLPRTWSILAAHWKQVLGLTAVFAIIYASVALLGATYVAKATLRTPDLTLAEFKRVIEAASDPVVVSEIVAHRFQGDDRGAGVARDLARDPYFADHFIPIYTISRSDLKETPVAPPSIAQQLVAPQTRRSDLRETSIAPPSAQQIVAVQTRGESADRATAGKLATLLAEAFADGALKNALVEYVATQRGSLAASKQRLEADIVSTRASLARAETKVSELEKLRVAYPEVSRGDARQVVSVAEGGARYLSPVTQLVGAASDAIDIRDSIRRSERKLRSLTWMNAVFDEAAKQNVTALSGSSGLAKLEAIVHSDPLHQVDDDEAIREARTIIEADLSELKGRYTIGYTILRAPLEQPSRTGPPLLAHAIGGILASLVIAVLLTLALHWKMVLDGPANRELRASTAGGQPVGQIMETS